MSAPKLRRVEDPDLAAVAALIGDTSRSMMLTALLGGETLSSSELARSASITLATASAHLGRLVRARLLLVTIRARTRYYTLAGAHVASALESLATLAPRASVPGSSPGEGARVLRVARMCYDHLAGVLGVAVTDAMLARGLLRNRHGSFLLAMAGEAWVRGLGIPLDELAGARRPLVRACLDWSERRPHLAGAVGAALASHFLEEGWTARVRASRALRLTDHGRAALARLLGVRLP